MLRRQRCLFRVSGSTVEQVGNSTFGITMSSSRAQLRIQAGNAGHDPLLLTCGHQNVCQVAHESTARGLNGVAHSPAKR